MTQPKHAPYFPYLAALGFTLIFGFSFVFSRTALQQLDPFHLLAFRFTLAAAFLNGLRLLGIVKIQVKTRQIGPLLLIAVFQPIGYFVTETIGIALTSASEAGMLVSVIPIFTVILAYLFLGENPPGPQVASILVSVAGVLLISAMQAAESIGQDLLGLGLLLTAALAGAAYSVLSRHFSTRFRPVEITYVMMNLGAVVFLSASLMQHAARGQLQAFFWPLHDATLVAAIVYLGVLSSVTAFFLLNFALSRLTASQVSAFPSLTTLIAVTAGALILGEALHWYHFVGGSLIISGVWGTNYFATATGRRRIASRLRG